MPDHDQPALQVRLLSRPDGSAYQTLRIEALQTNPEAFFATLETEQNRHAESFANELDFAYAPPTFGYYGAFDGDRLVGFCLVNQTALPKQNHLAFFYNMYVTPNYRRQGLARHLLDTVTHNLAEHGVEGLYLSCLAKNHAARRFYQQYGFKRCGITPRSSYWLGEYDDEVHLVLFLK